MSWIAIIIVVAILGACLDSEYGKLVIGAAVVGIGLLLLSWITGIGFFITLAKGCAVVIVITIVGIIISAIGD